MRVIWACFAGLLLLSVGCGGSHEQAICEELAGKIGQASERCQPGSYKQTYDGFVQALGGCGKVKKVRDEASLRAECYPFWGTVECSVMADQTGLQNAIPAACKSQLLI